ncbi:SapC family protein [Wenxinia marina]|uniref:SapC n=1 Tax=Wenxinia marina DSM 24838 TaxID=1123501 RepID=A0A0D0QE23_9RHOB|nr:SapC family protein [Wenxinia marina]KIQ69263.1 SapC [Wenxinia marina DSM 24838]GGL71634.1 peptidase [Wenxinia marina]
MPVQQLFYRSAIPVSPQRHGDVSVKTGHSFAFASRANSAPITAVEFGPAAGDHPIVFAGSGDDVFPAVILGTRDAENLSVDAAGQWKGSYIPAFVRRYPFVFTLDEERNQFTLLIDEEFEGVNKTGRGERLFDSDGEQTSYLKGILRFLQDFQAQFVRTQAFCRRLKELDLLTPMQAQFSLAEGEKRTLSGFLVVNREKLKALDPETVADLLAKDELECIFLHLSSMRHFSRMLERTQPAAATGSATPGPDDAADRPADRDAALDEVETAGNA